MSELFLSELFIENAAPPMLLSVMMVMMMMATTMMMLTIKVTQRSGEREAAAPPAFR